MYVCVRINMTYTLYPTSKKPQKIVRIPKKPYVYMYVRTVQGGTWEHRKRAKEMLATAKRNLELTVQANTKRNKADY